jgi:uncharacterized protein
MADDNVYPGVYIEEIPTLPLAVVPVSTAIPAFIGYTEKAIETANNDLLLKPFRIGSLNEYSQYFGGPQKEEGIVVTFTPKFGFISIFGSNATATLPESRKSKHILFYSLQLYFDNGGGPCWIVPVGTYKPRVGDPLVLSELLAGLNALSEVDEPTLIVIPESQNLAISDFKTLQDAALLQCKTLQDRFTIMDIHGGNIPLSNPDVDMETAVANFRTSGIGTDNLKYGAAYTPNIVTTIKYAIDEAKTGVRDVVKGRPMPATKLNILRSTNARKYQLAKTAISTLKCVLPPSGAIAGIIVSVDNNRGVWKAPANVSINDCLGPVVNLDKNLQERMNVDAANGKSINTILAFTGKGTMVWGSRTLAGNDNEWRYVSVSRLFIFVEESAKKAVEQFVFEPNDANTWVKVQGMLENFLATLWRQGALQGVKTEQAFYVAIGLGKTMTAQDIAEGLMILEIGLAVVRPAEFIIARFSQKMSAS